MSHPHPGRHELGQNFLTDRTVIDRVVTLVQERPGPIVEWGTGNGSITRALAALRRPIEGIEIDARRARRLNRQVGPHVCISAGDILRHAPPDDAVIVSSIPFHLTTPILRHLLTSSGWRSAVLITQWEVARKRAGVGGATQLTAQWWPWYDLSLDRRIAAAAFRPRPSVDAGLLLIERRVRPGVSEAARADYQAWVARIFASRGRGLKEILARHGVPRTVAVDLAERRGRRSGALPRDLRSADWVEAYAALSARRRRGGS